MNRDTTHTAVSRSPSLHRWLERLHIARRLPAGALSLPESGTWSLEHCEPVQIRILSGTAWITQQGDPEDHVVEAPGSFATPGHGRVALMAFAPVRFAVAPALRSAA